MRSRAGQENVTKIGLFDDNNDGWAQIRNHHKGLPSNTPFDFSDRSSWKYVFDYNYKVFFELIPSYMWYRVDGKPVIAMWIFSKEHYPKGRSHIGAFLEWLKTEFKHAFGVAEQGLFERIVHVLSDTAQVDCSGDPEKMSVRHRKKLRMLALQSVVALSKCLVDITALPDLPEEEMGDTTNTPIRGARAGSVTGSPGDGISNPADQANAVTLAERTSVADAVESFDKKQRI